MVCSTAFDLTQEVVGVVQAFSQGGSVKGRGVFAKPRGQSTVALWTGSTATQPHWAVILEVPTNVVLRSTLVVSRPRVVAHLHWAFYLALWLSPVGCLEEGGVFHFMFAVILLCFVMT